MMIVEVDEVVEDLEVIVDRLIKQLQLGEHVDVNLLVREYPQYASKLRTLVPVIQELARLNRPRGALNPSAIGQLEGIASEGAPPTLGEYEILQEVGRGGMGVVYRARQRTLGDIVALKVVPMASLSDSRQLARFHIEARAAATLQHPHIVPVYSVGEDRGVHYYAMKYIAGPTLARIIEQHRAERRSSLSPYYLTVARWGVQAAAALAHAHGHGIVHRDIKPSNLLVDDTQNIWITDFGLARLELGTTITGSGTVLGTWRYMSPEQASGNSSLVDHRTDIYSLGVTLYEALTLQPAFSGSSHDELLRQITSKNPPMPRSLDRAIPYDLETIVVKAMSKDPADRYRTATELAEDLQRFVEGRAICGRRASVVQRLRRVIKRHSDLVFVAALALFVVSVSISVAATMIWQANQRTQDALARQDAALERATEKTQMVRQAADAMYRNVLLEGLADDPQLTTTQRRFLESALATYQQLSQESSQEFSAQLETGHTLAHMGDVLSMSGRWKEALAAAERAIEVLSPLRQREPDNPDVLRPLGQLYHNYAVRLGRSGRSEEAIAAGRKAVEVVQRLAELEPDNIRHLGMLASIELVQSVSLRSLGKLPDAESSARRAWECAVAASRKFDTYHGDAWSTAFGAAGNLAAVLQDLGRIAESEQVCREAIRECEALLTEHPDDLGLTSRLGQLLGTLGGKLFAQEKLPEAEEVLRRALSAIERTLAHGESPANLLRTDLCGERALDQQHDPAAFLSHASDQVRLGEILKRQGQWEEAKAILEEAVFVLGELVDRYPQTPNYQAILARGEWFLARVLRKTQEPDEAEQRFRRAVVLYHGLSDKNPRFYESLSLVYCQLGNLLLDVDRPEEAREAYEAGIEQSDKSLEWMPDQPSVREDLAMLHANLGRINDRREQVIGESSGRVDSPTP